MLPEISELSNFMILKFRARLYFYRNVLMS